MHEANLTSSDPGTRDAGALDTGDVDRSDLEEIRRMNRRQARTRLAVAAGFALAGAALAWPPWSVPLPKTLLPAAIVVAVVVGVCSVIDDVTTWFHDRFALIDNTGRWRIVRRWYAPRAAVLRDGRLVVVLDWTTDALCREPWVLVYRDSDDAGAAWVPLSRLTPLDGGEDR